MLTRPSLQVRRRGLRIFVSAARTRPASSCGGLSERKPAFFPCGTFEWPCFPCVSCAARPRPYVRASLSARPFSPQREARQPYRGCFVFGSVLLGTGGASGPHPPRTRQLGVLLQDLFRADESPNGVRDPKSNNRDRSARLAHNAIAGGRRRERERCARGGLWGGEGAGVDLVDRPLCWL